MKNTGFAITVAFAAFGFLAGAFLLGMNRTHANAGLKATAEAPAQRDSVAGLSPPVLAPTTPPTAAAAMPAAISEAERNLQLARGASQSKDYDLAVSYLNEALRLRPDYRDALVERCVVRCKANQRAGALADANAVLRLASGDAELAQGYGLRGGVEQLQFNNYDAAIRDCSEALRLGGNLTPFVTVYVVRGEAYRRKNEQEKAIADCSTAIQLDPSYPEAFGIRGMAYASLEKIDEAFADLDRTLELRPCANYYVARGCCHGMRGQHVAAIQDAWAALALDPQTCTAYWLLAESYAKLGDGQNAGIYRAKYEELTRQQLGK